MRVDKKDNAKCPPLYVESAVSAAGRKVLAFLPYLIKAVFALNYATPQVTRPGPLATPHEFEHNGSAWMKLQ
jgi:hypothetical protein